jgi:fumarate reductase flavoprotein subunit
VDVDVIVVGAGAAGSAAALRAADGPGRVLVLERDPRYLDNSNTARSTGMVPAAGSALQRRAGVEDDPERMLADIMAKTGGSADPELARALCGVSARLVDTMAEAWDAPLELVRDFRYPGHSADRMHAPPDRKGRTWLEVLAARLKARPNVDLALGAAVTDVRPNADGSGFRVRVGDGGEEVTCRCLILATNGFGADRAMVAEHLPEISRAVYFGGPFSDGSGIRWGMAMGADTAYMDAYQGHGSIAPDAGTLVSWAVIVGGGFLLNARGERFCDESHGYSETALPVLAQPGGWVYDVFDEELRQEALRFADFRETDAMGVVGRAEDEGALASRLGVPPEALAATLEEIAACVRTGRPDRFGRRFARTLRPPYRFVRVTGALFHTQGGLRVDGKARVLRPDGMPIPGLYAAGGTAHGISGRGASGYLAGNGLLAALGLGLLAGEGAAARLAGASGA